MSPSAHQPALFLIQSGMTFLPSLAPCSVDGMTIIPFDISHCMPETNEPSSMSPSAHQPALFLIQSGIAASWAETLGTNIMLTKKIPENKQILLFNMTCNDILIFYIFYLLLVFDYQPTNLL